MWMEIFMLTTRVLIVEHVGKLFSYSVIYSAKYQVYITFI